MLRYTGPLLTRDTALVLLAARERGEARWAGSLDLGRTQGEALLEDEGWRWHGIAYPYPGKLKDRTLYWWDGEDFAPVSRYAGSLIKLVPTEWGVPTFEIDGIKMLPTSRESPLDDAQRKVALVEPRGKVVLDTCGGLGYFAACCLAAGATRERAACSRYQRANCPPSRTSATGAPCSTTRPASSTMTRSAWFIANARSCRTSTTPAPASAAVRRCRNSASWCARSSAASGSSARIHLGSPASTRARVRATWKLTLVPWNPVVLALATLLAVTSSAFDCATAPAAAM